MSKRKFRLKREEGNNILSDQNKELVLEGFSSEDVIRTVFNMDEKSNSSDLTCDDCAFLYEWGENYCCRVFDDVLSPIHNDRGNKIKCNIPACPEFEFSMKVDAIKEVMSVVEKIEGRDCKNCGFLEYDRHNNHYECLVSGRAICNPEEGESLEEHAVYCEHWVDKKKISALQLRVVQELDDYAHDIANEKVDDRIREYREKFDIDNHLKEKGVDDQLIKGLLQFFFDDEEAVERCLEKYKEKIREQKQEEQLCQKKVVEGEGVKSEEEQKPEMDTETESGVTEIIKQHPEEKESKLAEMAQKPVEEVRQIRRKAIEDNWVKLSGSKYYTVKEGNVYLATLDESQVRDIQTIPYYRAKQIYDKYPGYLLNRGKLDEVLTELRYKFEGYYLLWIMALEFGGEVRGDGSGEVMYLIKSGENPESEVEEKSEEPEGEKPKTPVEEDREEIPWTKEEDNTILNKLTESVANVASMLQRTNEEVRERKKFLIKNYWTPLTSIKYYTVKDGIIYLATTMSYGQVSIDTMPLDDARELYDEMPDYVDGNAVNDMLNARGYKHMEGTQLLRIMSFEFGGEVQGGGRGKKITFVKGKSESENQRGAESEGQSRYVPPTESKEEAEYAEVKSSKDIDESGADVSELKGTDGSESRNEGSPDTLIQYLWENIDWGDNSRGERIEGIQYLIKSKYGIDISKEQVEQAIVKAYYSG